MKHFGALAVLAFGLALLAGCSQGGQPAQSGASAGPTTALQGPFYTAVMQERAAQGSGNGKAFYSLEWKQDGTKLIRAADYASMRETYLCSAPSCAHNSETCTAWLPADGGMCTLYALPDKLLVLCQPAQGSPHLDVMQLDGRDKTTLYTFPDGSRIDEGAVYNESGIVLKVTQARQNETTVSEAQQLVHISFDGGAACTVYEIENENSDVLAQGHTTLFLREATDAGLLIKTVSMGASGAADPLMGEEEIGQMLDSQMASTVYTISLLPYSGGQPETLLSFSAGQCV